MCKSSYDKIHYINKAEVDKSCITIIFDTPLSNRQVKELEFYILELFTLSESLFKTLYLAQDKITSKWNVSYGNWCVIYSSLQIIFEGRL